MQNSKIIIYTDGGSRGNPGEAAIGVAIEDAKGHKLHGYGERIGVKTNNEAEYEAVIFALKKVKQIFGKDKTKQMGIEMRMDSQLVARQLNGEYRIEEEHLFPFFIKIWNLKFDFGKIIFKHIPREKNKEADRLLNRALDQNEQGRLL